MNFFSAAFSSSSDHLTGTALLVCLFWIGVARSHRISSVRLFRVACWTFAVGFLTPNFISMYFSGNGMGSMNLMPGQVTTASSAIISCLLMLSPTLYMLSFILAMSSIALGGNSDSGFKVMAAESEM